MLNNVPFYDGFAAKSTLFAVTREEARRGLSAYASESARSDVVFALDLSRKWFSAVQRRQKSVRDLSDEGDSHFPFRSSDNIDIARSDFAVCVVKEWENGRQTDTGMMVQ